MSRDVRDPARSPVGLKHELVVDWILVNSLGGEAGAPDAGVVTTLGLQRLEWDLVDSRQVSFEPVGPPEIMECGPNKVRRPE